MKGAAQRQLVQLVAPEIGEAKTFRSLASRVVTGERNGRVIKGPRCRKG